MKINLRCKYAVRFASRCRNPSVCAKCETLDKHQKGSEYETGDRPRPIRNLEDCG